MLGLNVVANGSDFDASLYKVLELEPSHAYYHVIPFLFCWFIFVHSCDPLSYCVRGFQFSSLSNLTADSMKKNDR